MAAAEVLVKLVVDSNAPKATSDLKRGLDKAHGSHKQFTKGLLDGKANMAALASVGTAAFAAVAAAAAAGAGAVVGLAVEATSAWLESEKQVRALAGTLTLLDTSGTGFETMTKISRGLKDGLEEVAMQVGTTDDALMAAFTDVIERGGKSIDQAKELTEQMANAGRAVPGGIGTISGAFEMIEMGAVRAKNPIVGMIAATHLLKGNAKQVAHQMQQMSPEKQMALAEKAIANMSKKMKDVPLSIEEMSTSMKVFVGNIFEEAGQPIVDNLMPLFTTIRKFAFDNQGVFKDVAKEFGNTVGKVVDVALPVSKEIMSSIKSSSSEIQDMMKTFTGPGRDAFKYIYDNKEAFAKTMGDVFKDMIKAARFFGETMNTVTMGLGDAAKLAARLSPGGKQFVAEERRSVATKALTTSIQAPHGRDPETVVRLENEYKEATMAAGASREAADAAYSMIVRGTEQKHAKVMGDVTQFKAAAVLADSASFVKAWKIAEASNDEGVKEYVAAFLLQNSILAKEIGVKGPELLGEGFGKLMDTIGSHLGQTKLLGQMQEAKTAADKAGVQVGKGPQVNQYIGTVNVKQDFKDIDPERVAIVFRNDLAKHGVARLQTRRG